MSAYAESYLNGWLDFSLGSPPRPTGDGYTDGFEQAKALHIEAPRITLLK
jgi:hypothetical protein